MTNFEGQVVLITGGARGLGFSYARCIGQLGALVLIQDIGADSNGDGASPAIAKHAADQLQTEGLDVHAMEGDISSREGCYRLVRDILAINGRLDAIIHNAGWVAYERIGSIEESSFDHMMAIAVKAPLWLAQAAWPSMSTSGYGRLVMTTSCRALYPQYVHEGLSSYSAAKSAVVGIMNVLAAEGDEKGIVVNAVSPVAKTRMWGVEGEPDELHPSDVAPGVAFLASSACRDSGWVLRASNGQFHATKTLEAEGVEYPQDLRAVRASTLQEVADKWQRIARYKIEPRS